MAGQINSLSAKQITLSRLFVLSIPCISFIQTVVVLDNHSSSNIALRDFLAPASG